MPWRSTVTTVIGGFATLTLCASSAVSARPSWPPPLHLQRLTPGERCPVSRFDPAVAFARRYGVAPGLGSGPVFPIGMSATAVLQIGSPASFHSHAWGGQKVLWLVLPTYHGPVLIRGRRLDGSGLVRFQDGNVPPAELRLAATSGGAIPTSPIPPAGTRYFPSYTRLRSPGCYAYQIDGTSFSRVVVFRAERR